MTALSPSPAARRHMQCVIVGKLCLYLASVDDHGMQVPAEWTLGTSTTSALTTWLQGMEAQMDRLSATDQQQSIVWDATAFKWPLDLPARSCTGGEQYIIEQYLTTTCPQAHSGSSCGLLTSLSAPRHASGWSMPASSYCSVWWTQLPDAPASPAM